MLSGLLDWVLVSLRHFSAYQHRHQRILGFAVRVHRRRPWLAVEIAQWAVSITSAEPDCAWGGNSAWVAAKEEHSGRGLVDRLRVVAVHRIHRC